jgi:2-succinyl-6-hydroxy-2,4-cyclohexadiene-1-carboxylate synthase
MSFGSLVAIEVAIRAGKQLDSLVLAAPTLGGMAPDPVAQERNMQLRRVFEQEGAGTHMTKLWMRSPPDIFRGIESKPTLWANLCEIINRHSWCELGHKAMGVIADHPHRGSVLASIHAHTMVLVGEEDMPTFKRNAHTILCAIPLCSRAYIEGCGHLPLIEDPNASAKLLSAHFLVTSQASTSSADGE